MMITSSDYDSPQTQRQIRWRCGHGGMLELDIVFTHFFDTHFTSLTFAQRQDFVDLLNLSDPQLFAWLMGVEDPDPMYRDLVERIRQSSLAADFKPL